MEKKYPDCPFCTSSAVVPDEGFYHCNNCGENFDSTGEVMPQLDEVHEPIHCPRCQSANWECWDERTLYCWDKDGREAGSKVVDYLRCQDCDNRWTDSTECPDGSTYDDD